MHGVWKLQHGVLESHPGRGLLLTMWKWPDGAGMGSCVAGNAFGEFPNCQRGRTLQLCHTQEAKIPLYPLPVNTYYKAIEKHQPEVPFMLRQPQARK